VRQFITKPCVNISQVVGCEDRLQNGLDCIGWGIKLYSNSKCHLLQLCLPYFICYVVRMQTLTILPSNSIWPHLSYGLVRSKRKYCH